MIVPGAALSLTFITASPVTVSPSFPTLNSPPTLTLSLPPENLHVNDAPEQEISSNSPTFAPSSNPTVPKDGCSGVFGSTYFQLSVIFSPGAGVVLLTVIVRPFGPVTLPSAATAPAAGIINAHPARTTQNIVRLNLIGIFTLPFRSLRSLHE